MKQSEERRRFPRTKATRQVVLRDNFARVAATGRTEDISDIGFLLVCKDSQYVPRKGRLFVEVAVPDPGGGGTHLERYACRVVRVVQRGQGQIALGIEILGR